jgi:DNA-binding response OmpR family regulator
VLIIDDDDGLRRRLESFFRLHMFASAGAPNGEVGLDMLAAGGFDAVLLDVMMPGLDGIEVIRRIRAESDVPVLMLTGKDTESDRVLGLELGADDYIAKPFRPRELLARVRAVLRRSHSRAPTKLLRCGDIEIDLARRTVQVGGAPLELSGIELDLLAALIRARGEVLSREALLIEAGRNHVTDGERTVDVHISRLRRKLGDDPRTPRRIKTVHGVGYVLAS